MTTRVSEFMGISAWLAGTGRDRLPISKNSSYINFRPENSRNTLSFPGSGFRRYFGIAQAQSVPPRPQALSSKAGRTESRNSPK